MPFYYEEYMNRGSFQSFKSSPAYLTAMDTARLTTYRSGPRKGDVRYLSEIPDTTADPYAWFLGNATKELYQARLAERGLKPTGTPDRGHPFELVKHTVLAKPLDIHYKYQSYPTDTYSQVLAVPTFGKTEVSVHNGSVVSAPTAWESGLDNFAQHAYTKSARTSVVFNAGQFLGELHEGLPKLVPDLLKGTSHVLRRAGSDYLNVEFGWLPFLNDLRNAGQALAKASSSLKGRNDRVHRKFSMPDITDFASYTGSFNSLTVQGGWSGALSKSGTPATTQTSVSGLSGSFTVDKGKTISRWFEGDFTNFLPLGFDDSDYLSKLTQLMDFRITPEVLWELAPWSWLVDWQLRIRDSIASNLDAADPLVIMHYGYAMEHSVYTTSVQWSSTVTSPSSYYGWVDPPLKGYVSSRTERKVRIRANPFGFTSSGLSGLNAGQIAILGALGLTKL